MPTPRNKDLLLNWIFLPGLILLALNDHYFKYSYHNPLTGKLSDFVGLLIFPLFLAYVFPRHTRLMAGLTGLFFIYWKSPWSADFITFYNRYSLIGITRTVDYTDLFALAVLPLSHFLIHNIDRFRITGRSGSAGVTSITGRFQPRPGWITGRFQPRADWLILPCSLVFMSTSPPGWYRSASLPKGDIYIGKAYYLRITPQQVLDTLRKEGYTPEQDTAYHMDSTTYYVIRNVALPDVHDTLRSIQFQLFKYVEGSVLRLNNINLKGTPNLGSWRLLKHYSKWYRLAVQKYVIRELH